jgi:2-keto-4-pentenoate hydratase/2-oxohepta-3-ene-1,7-dioic acid hydratase in catechol pathway
MSGVSAAADHSSVRHTRLVAFETPERSGYGLLREDGIADLSRRLAGSLPTLQSVIETGAWAEAEEAGRKGAIDLALGEFSFLPPIPERARIICVGVNYPDRAAEYADAAPAPPYPSLFIRFASSFVGHGGAMVRPTVSEQLDYEGEIVLVIGKAGRHIPEVAALDHVAALTLCNEGSVRDWLRHGKFNVTQGKNFDRSGAIGPWLVQYVDERQVEDVRLTTRVNGALRQDDRTSRMIFGFRSLIRYVSTFMELAPGDMIVTGTPTGAGARRDPPEWLRAGDVIEVEAEGIGLLRNTVEDEQ